MKEEVKQISSRIFDWEGLYYSNSSIWLWWLSNIVKTCTCSYEVPQSHRQGNPDNPETVQIETLFWKISFFCFFRHWLRKSPIWDVTVPPQTSAVFLTTYSAAQVGKANVHGICQIDYTSKFPVIQNSKFLNHFKRRNKPNLLEICHSCTMYTHKISKDIPSRI